MSKINIRESLKHMDEDTFCRYDLTTMYDSCVLDDEDKKVLAKMLYDKEDPEVIYQKLCMYFDDDQVADIDSYLMDVPVEGKYESLINKCVNKLSESYKDVSYNDVANQLEFNNGEQSYVIGVCPFEDVDTDDYEVFIDYNYDSPCCFNSEEEALKYILNFIKNKVNHIDDSDVQNCDDEMVYTVYDIVEDDDNRLVAKCMNESTNDFEDIKLGKTNTNKVIELVNNMLNNPNYKVTKETKDKIYKNSAPWGLAVQMTPSVDVDGTNDLLATGDFGGDVSFGESVEETFEKDDRVTDGDREGTVIDSDSQKVLVEWDYSETDDIEWVDKSTLELVNEINSRFLPNMEYCPACGGTRFNVKTGVCIDCGYNEGDWGTVQESLEENDEDGWGDRVEQILEPTIRKVEDLAYEVRNTVRGANTGCDTTDELADYVDEVIEDFEDANSSLRHEAEEIDESKSIEVFGAKPGKLKEAEEILYVIKDSHGNQLSRPTVDDGELWDRVASMEARGRRGLSVVVYTGKKECLSEAKNVPYKKEEFKKQLQDELYDKMIKLFYTPEWGFENIKEIDDFINPIIEIEDYKGDYDNDFVAEIRGEFTYDELEDVGDILDPIVQKYDKEAYFEPVTSGITRAYIKLSDIKESINEDTDVEDSEDGLISAEQEFDSAATSINSNKLPAVYNMVKFNPGDVVVDFGGGKFDNAVSYLKDQDVTLLVYDPYNRRAEHNKEVLKVLREHGGADAAVNSNVLNVIKEPEARNAVLQNIKKITKKGAPIYITVYEGTGKGNEGPTKSGYQLNRKTADYMDEISQVFSNVKRRGKLITAINESVAESYSEDRKRLKDKIISTLEFLDTFEDIYKFPETILGDSWEDLKSGILMGVDTAYEEIAQTLVDYLEPSVEFDKRHPELLDEDPVAADALEEYENLKSELKESSYGGAFDIEDDQYFTKEEIVGVAEKVCEHLNETYPDKFDVSDVYMETPTIIHVEVISKEGNWASANAKIDMRKIKKPSDIMKYDVVIGTLVYNLRLELDDLYGDEYMRESLSNDKLSRELQTYLQRLFGDYVEVESVEYFESPFGEESYTAEINVSELVNNYIDKRFTPLTYKLKEDGYLYVNKYSDIIVDVNGYESGVTLDCYNTVPYDVDMEQLDKEADIIGDKIIDVIQSHEEDIYDILRQHYYEEIEDDEELAESLLDIEIDMWYNDNPKDVTSLDVNFSDLDTTYRGNLYINNKIVGDYTTKDSVVLEKTFPQFDWDAFWDKSLEESSYGEDFDIEDEKTHPYVGKKFQYFGKDSGSNYGKTFTVTRAYDTQDGVTVRYDSEDGHQTITAKPSEYKLLKDSKSVKRKGKLITAINESFSSSGLRQANIGLSYNSIRYKGYRISLLTDGSGYAIFDKHGEMEDHGFKSIKDAKSAIDEFNSIYKPVLSKGLSEASYGGAFDIEDDQYFTKEDIMDLADEVCERLYKEVHETFDISDLYMDGNTLHMELESDSCMVETNVKIDMRKIRKPLDIMKYALPITNKLLSQVKDCYNY